MPSLNPHTLVLHFWEHFPNGVFHGHTAEHLPGLTLEIDVFAGSRPKHVWTMGRHSPCDFVINSGLLSRLQCSIVHLDSGIWLLQDGGKWADNPDASSSENGTWIRSPDSPQWKRMGGRHNMEDSISIPFNNPEPLTPGTMVALPIPGPNHTSQGRFVVGATVDDTLNSEIWEDDHWRVASPSIQQLPPAVSRVLDEEPLRSRPWYAALARDALDWIQTPKTPLAAVYRLLILAIAAVVVVLIFGAAAQ
jgi:hypothetical protein